MSLKCVCVGFYKEATPITIHNRDKKNNILKADVDKIPSKIRALRSAQGERDKLKTAYGVWFVTHKNNIFYAICADQTYPQRHAFGLAQKIKTKIQGRQGQDRFVKNAVQEVADTYSDLKKVDKVRKAHEQVQMLEGDLQKGIKKFIQNKQTLEELDDKAQEMKHFSKQFAKKAQVLEKDMCWSKWKIYILIGGVVALIVAIIIIIIVVTSSGSDQDTH